MEMKHRPHISVSQILLVVSGAQEGQRYPVRSQRRLDHVRNVLFILLIVKIGHILSGGILMLGQVIIRPVRDAPKLAPAEGE